MDFHNPKATHAGWRHGSPCRYLLGHGKPVALIGGKTYQEGGKMDKKTFTETLLNDAIVAAARYVMAVEWINDEQVDVVCNNGYRYPVNIACDSSLDIMFDVLAEVMRH